MGERREEGGLRQEGVGGNLLGRGECLAYRCYYHPEMGPALEVLEFPQCL